MNAVRVKICGLTRAADVDAAIEAGADAVGFVFARSPRQIEPAQAAELAIRVPESILRVGLFMHQEGEEIRHILAQVELDLLQFHGDADNDFCRSFGLPFLKAVSAASGDAADDITRYPDAAGVLFDTPGEGGAGGTGRTFDWRLVDPVALPLWLAGGLNPENVAAAIAAVQPDWVDVSSGVEDAPGIKNADRVRAFIHAARTSIVRIDCEEGF